MFQCLLTGIFGAMACIHIWNVACAVMCLYTSLVRVYTRTND